MEKFTFQILLAIFATCSTLLIKQQNVSAQVNMSLLTEVAKSCQKDTVSPAYYDQMGINRKEFESAKIDNSYFIDKCIYSRYFHSLVQSKFSWLSSVDEIIPGYPGSVAVSIVALNSAGSSLLDCIASRNPSSQACKNHWVLSRVNDENKIANDYFYHSSNGELLYIYICPSCVIASDNVRSYEKMTGGFISWFLRLDKPRRREIMSILGDEEDQKKNRWKIEEESERAVREYNDIIKKVKHQEENRRRREVLEN
jgi:hypothetical protein